MWKSEIKFTFHVEFTFRKWKCGKIPADFGLRDKSGENNGNFTEKKRESFGTRKSSNGGASRVFHIE